MKPIETTTEEKKYVNNEIAASEKKNQPGPFGHVKHEEKPIEPQSVNAAHYRHGKQ